MTGTNLIKTLTRKHAQLQVAYQSVTSSSVQGKYMIARALESSIFVISELEMCAPMMRPAGVRGDRACNRAANMDEETSVDLRRTILALLAMQCPV